MRALACVCVCVLEALAVTWILVLESSVISVRNRWYSCPRNLPGCSIADACAETAAEADADPDIRTFGTRTQAPLVHCKYAYHRRSQAKERGKDVQRQNGSVWAKTSTPAHVRRKTGAIARTRPGTDTCTRKHEARPPAPARARTSKSASSSRSM